MMYNGIQCARCRNKKLDVVAFPECRAYPKGIPDAILNDEHDHHKPYPGDGGIRFEPIE